MYTHHEITHYHLTSCYLVTSNSDVKKYTVPNYAPRNKDVWWIRCTYSSTNSLLPH